MTEITTLPGGMLVSKSTIIRLLQSVLPSRSSGRMTIYDVGYEAAKADIAEIVAGEFHLETGKQKVGDFIKALRE